MSRLPVAGERAPDVSLSDLAEKPFELYQELARADRQGILLVFYKTNCPTCQLTLPYLEKFHRAYGDQLGVLGVSQSEREATVRFGQEKGITFPQLLDGPDHVASDAYGITVVPSILLLDKQGRVQRTQIAWDRHAIEALSDMASALTENPKATLFSPSDEAPLFKPG